MKDKTLLLDNYLKPTNTFVRFLLVGVMNTIIGLTTIFILMNVLEWSYWSSTFIGNGVGATISYLLNRSFTFQSNISFSKGAIRFVAIIFVSYLISYSLSERIAKLLAENPTLFISENNTAVLIGTVLYTFLNYSGQKYIVFAEQPLKD